MSPGARSAFAFGLRAGADRRRAASCPRRSASPGGTARGRHQEQLEGGVVVHRHAAVDEDERAASPTWIDFRRKVRRRGGAGAHQLPQREVEVAVGPSVVVVLRRCGLFDSGHGESVVALRITIISSVRSFVARRACLARRAPPCSSRCELARPRTCTGSVCSRPALSNISAPLLDVELRGSPTRAMPSERHVAMIAPVLVPAM